MHAENKGASGDVGATSETVQRDLKFELYKLEYERAAIRYEDIYKAVWQIFSYMTAISGAFLAFGGDRFQQNLFWFLASAPLVYWFWGTYVPLNTYGTDVGRRLCAIETQLNKDYHVRLDHYCSFEKRKTPKGRNHLRVCHVAWPVFIALSAFLIFQGFRTASARCAGIPLIRETPPEVKIVTVNADELRKLMESAKGSQTPRGISSTTKAN